MKERLIAKYMAQQILLHWFLSRSGFLRINPENAFENPFRVKPASNQRLRPLFFCIRTAAAHFEKKALIFCMFGFHFEVLMHYLDLTSALAGLWVLQIQSPW
jgi:hypothetical protein